MVQVHNSDCINGKKVQKLACRSCCRLYLLGRRNSGDCKFCIINIQFLAERKGGDGKNGPQAGARQNCSNITRRHRPCAICSECCKSLGRSGVSQTIEHSPTECTICRITAACPHSTNHVCRLCCSRALWTEKQRAPLVSASKARCSAVQSMAPVRVLLPQTKQNKERTTKERANTQTNKQRESNQTTEKNKKRGGRTRKKNGMTWQRQKNTKQIHQARQRILAPRQ